MNEYNNNNSNNNNHFKVYRALSTKVSKRFYNQIDKTDGF